MTDSLTIIVRHCSRTLPENLAERKQLLRAMEHVLHPKHPAAGSIRSQIAAIKALEQLQEELPLKFD